MTLEPYVRSLHRHCRPKSRGEEETGHDGVLARFRTQVLLVRDQSDPCSGQGVEQAVIRNLCRHDIAHKQKGTCKGRVQAHANLSREWMLTSAQLPSG